MRTGLDKTVKKSVSRAERMVRVQWVLGLGLTIAMSILVGSGTLDSADFASQDLRQRAFHRSRAQPSSEIVLILIDDATLATYGRWPWPRSLLAEAVDQLSESGASVIAFDLLLDDPQSPELVQNAEGAVSLLDHDAVLAESIRKSGRCFLASSFGYGSDQVNGARRGTPGVGDVYLTPGGVERATFDSLLKQLRAEPALSDEELWTRFFSRDPIPGPPLAEFARSAADARQLLAQERVSGVPVPPDGDLWPESHAPEPPIPQLVAAARGIASVSFARGDSDNSVRRIPLWTRVGEAMYPALGLASAALHLGVPLQQLEVTSKATALPVSDEEILAVPTHAAPLYELAALGPLHGMSYLTWPEGGFGGWTGQFPHIQQIPLGRILDPRRVILPSIRTNLKEIDTSMLGVAPMFELVAAGPYRQRASDLLSLDPREPEFQRLLNEQRVAWNRAVADAKSMVDAFRSQGLDPSELTEDERARIDIIGQVATKAEQQINEIVDGVARYIHSQKQEIPQMVRGKICFIGWSATGSLADFVRTSVHSSTPGVLVHAAVANSILTSREESQFLVPAPMWASISATIILGLIGALVGIRASVLISPLMLVTILVCWIVFDGIILWDSGRLVVAEVAPIGTAFSAWLLVTLHRLLIEQRGRKRTEERFRAYVPPDVVDILVNNPTLSSMAPQKRELTILFSDIEGFTTLSEQLGTEGISKLLSAYLGAMTQILQARRATLDKYLGDGIMAFWGAPIEDAEHAKNAANAAVQMLEQLQWMNDAGAFDGASKGVRLNVRIGMAAGEVNVGDFGNPPSKSAYTVIGDSVNLAARLESANKQFGTSILVNGRMRELMGDALPARMIGRVVVKGKKQFETLYEILGPGRLKGEKTAAWVEATELAVNAFINKDFDSCVGALSRLESEFDDGMLADVYRHAVATHLMDGPSKEEFTGAIVLSEK